MVIIAVPQELKGKPDEVGNTDPLAAPAFSAGTPERRLATAPTVPAPPLPRVAVPCLANMCLSGERNMLSLPPRASNAFRP